MPRQQISFLLPDIASPVLGPILSLAGSLQQDYEVQIAGPDMGLGVCRMYRGLFSYTTVSTPRLYRFPDYFWEARRLEKAVAGDVVIAVKAFASSVPVALSAKKHRGAKVIAYLDEWDGALMARLSPQQRRRRWREHFIHPLDDVYCPLVEKQLPRCDRIISTTTALQKKFGGDVVPCGVDMDVFAPQPEETVSAERAALGLTGKRLIIFGGVVRPHKGIELILSALARLGDSQNQLVIVGPLNEHVGQLQQDPAFAPYLTAIGPRPKETMPLYLSMADAVVLPLKDDLLAQTQMPCKIFEAMSMARPIIASAVSDLPEVLEGCGWLVPPDDAAALAERLAFVFAHPQEAAETGLRAWEKCRAQYSREVAGAQLRSIVQQVLEA